MSWNKITEEKHNQDFVGHAELCEWRFSVPLPEQLSSGWVANRVIDGHIEELQNQGSQILEITVWEDTEPTFNTEYYVRVIATASPLFWNVIIVGVIALLAIAGLTYMLVKTEDIVEYVGDEAGGVGISLTMAAAIGVAAVIGIALLKR